MATQMADGMIDIRRYVPGTLIRHINRGQRRRPTPQVTHDTEHDTFSFHHLSRKQAEAMLALLRSDPKFYGLCTRLLNHLYPDTPLARIQAFLDGGEGVQG